jgi:hypothetical protein
VKAPKGSCKLESGVKQWAKAALCNLCCSLSRTRHQRLTRLCIPRANYHPLARSFETAPSIHFNQLAIRPVDTAAAAWIASFISKHFPARTLCQ